MPRRDGKTRFMERTRKRRKRVGKHKEHLRALRAQGAVPNPQVRAMRRSVLGVPIAKSVDLTKSVPPTWSQDK